MQPFAEARHAMIVPTNNAMITYNFPVANAASYNGYADSPSFSAGTRPEHTNHVVVAPISSTDKPIIVPSGRALLVDLHSSAASAPPSIPRKNQTANCMAAIIPR